MGVCNNCNTENLPEAEFCENCGSKLENEQIDKIESEDIQYCEKCGSKANKNDTFCGNCGIKLIENGVNGNLGNSCENTTEIEKSGKSQLKSVNKNTRKNYELKSIKKKRFSYKTIIYVLVSILILLFIAPFIERSFFFMSANTSSYQDYNWGKEIAFKGGSIENGINLYKLSRKLGIEDRAQNNKLWEWLKDSEIHTINSYLGNNSYKSAKNFAEESEFLNDYRKKELLGKYESKIITNYLTNYNYDEARSFVKETEYLTGEEVMDLFRDYEEAHFSVYADEFISVELTSNYNYGQSYVPESKYIERHEYLFSDDAYYTIETYGGYNESYVSGTLNHLVVTNKFIAVTIVGEVLFTGQREESSFARSFNATFTFGKATETITETFSFNNIEVKPHEIKHYNKTVVLESEALFHTKSADLKNVRIKSTEWWYKY
jgi:ribosomal protein L40E